MYSVPLRRALVTGSTLPSRKGRAAEVLKVAADVGAPRRTGAAVAIFSAAAAAGYGLASAPFAEEAHDLASARATTLTAASRCLYRVGHLIGSRRHGVLLGVVLAISCSCRSHPGGPAPGTSCGLVAAPFAKRSGGRRWDIASRFWT